MVNSHGHNLFRWHSQKLSLDFLQLSEVFPSPDSDSRVRELKDWLVAKGVSNFEAVPLNCESVEKVSSWTTHILVQVLISGGRRPLRKSRNWRTSC